MLPSEFPLSLPLTHVPVLGLPAIPEGWPQQLPGSLQPLGLSLPWSACPLEGLHSCGAAPNTASPWEKACSLEEIEQARLGHEKSAYILRQSFQVGLPWGRASWVLSSPASHSSPWGGAALLQNNCQHCQPPTRAPQPKNIRASSAQLSEICFHHGVDLPVLSSFASERLCQPCLTSEKAMLPQR